MASSLATRIGLVAGVSIATLARGWGMSARAAFRRARRAGSAPASGMGALNSSPGDDIRGWILRPSDRSSLTPALFLDRDGVIVEEVGHLGRSESVQLIPGASAAIARANGLGVPVVVITNQAGIGKGLYQWSGFESVNREMIRQLADEGAWLDAIFACPFHPDAFPPYQATDHFGRKPEPGMLLQAGRDLDLDLRASWIVGDTLSDIVAGRRARLEGAVLVLTGHGTRHREEAIAQSDEQYPVLVAPTLGVAAAMIPFLT